MGWLLLVALGVMWVAFLIPTWRRHPGNTVKGFERDMDLLADTDGGEGRWIVTPRKGMTFVGPRARAQARARERRRRILVVLIESLALTALMGLFPPLRAMWFATAVLLVALGAYVWLLLMIKTRSTSVLVGPRASAPAPARPARHRYAADASGRTARAAYNGLMALGEDPEAIVVRSAGTAGVAGV